MGKNNHRIARRLRFGALGPAINLVPRFLTAMSYCAAPVKSAFSWTFSSREFTNFTYDITDQNILYGAHAISIALNEPLGKVLRYVHELRDDVALKEHIIRISKTSKLKNVSDARCDFGRRLFWYALVRLAKPGLVVETGIDKGLGSVVLCAALLKNREEGVKDSRYIGLDINPDAGSYLERPYTEIGEIWYGDSLASLSKLQDRIGLFVNDSDHSAAYEAAEYEAIRNKLTPDALIIGDNAHVTDCLARFSERNSRAFLFIPEQPRGHWYPGSGVGISVPMNLPGPYD